MQDDYSEDEILEAYLKRKEEELDKEFSVSQEEVLGISLDQGPKKGKKRRLATKDYLNFFDKKGWFFAVNDLNERIEFNGQPFSDFHLAQIKSEMRDELPGAKMEVAEDCILVAAGQNRYNPIKNYLTHLKWDGIKRIEILCDCIKSKNDTIKIWLPKWLAGCIAKIYQGWQNPVLVLNGPQDIGKSYFVKWLCFNIELFLSSAIFPDHKDCKFRLTDTFIWEINELGSTTRRQDVDALKAFLTLTTVRDRLPYAKFATEKPTVTNFIGTLNPGNFLLDRTGNRRFLVSEIISIDWKYAKLDLNQIWAEAIDLYRKGQFKLTKEEKEGRDTDNEEFLTLDPIEEILPELYTITHKKEDFVSIAEILEELTAKNIPPRRDVAASIATFMLKEGCKKVNIRRDGKRRKGYIGVKKD